MEDENIFEYGPYKLYKDAFKENLAKNIDKYIKDHNLTDPELEQDFRAAVDFIRDGIGGYITHMNGSGLFKDNKGYLTSTKQGHKYAANYINFIANKLGALGNATPKKKEEEKEIVEEKKKTLFDPNKHLIGLEFESAANPLGNDSGYSLWKEGLNDPLGLLRQYITTHKAGLDNYDFSGTNLTKDFYEKSLNSLLSNLEDNEISEKDAEMMSRLGFKNPRAFMPLADPTPAVSNISEERLAQLMDSGWKVDPTSKNWLDPTGHNTQLPATVDPENPGENYKELFAAYQLHLKGNIPNNSSEIDTEAIDKAYKDLALSLGPTFFTLASIVNPEPITGTISGLIGDFWNLYDNATDEDGLTWGDGGEFLFNLAGTAAGAIPGVGDFVGGNAIKLVLGIKKAHPAIKGLLGTMATAGIGYYGYSMWNGITSTLENVMTKDIKDLTKDDIINATNVVVELLQLYKNLKSGYKYSKAKETAKLNDGVYIKGKDANDKTKRYVLTGLDASNVKDLTNLDDVKDLLTDFGFTPIELPSKNKNVYNPDLLKRESGEGKFSRARGWAENEARNTEMAKKTNGTLQSNESITAPAKIKTVDDLRNTVKAKLQADGKSEEVINLVDALLRNVKMDDRGLITKGLLKIRGAKYSDEFEQAVGILVNNGYSRPKATEMLLGVGLHKEGGILKASTGVKINANDIDLRTYKGWEEHFNYDETNKVYSLKDGYNKEALTKWGTTNGLNITLPNYIYGTDKYVYTPQSSLYKEGATSIGFNGSNDLRSDLLMYDTPDTTGELDLNEFAESRKMYLQIADAEKGTSSGEQLRRGDFLNWFKNNYEKGMSLEQMLEKYNSGIDRMYGFKLSDKGITYTGGTGLGNDETEEFNIGNFNYYFSLNGPALHGFDKKSQRQNGSGTMGRSVDRTKVTIAPFTEEELKEFNIYKGDDGLFNILSTNSFTNDGTGRYYTGNPELTITKINPEGLKGDPKGDGSGNNGVKPGEVDGSGLTGDNNSKEIVPTGDPMTKKPNRSWEPAFSAFNYFNALRTNKRILDKTNELTPLLYDPVEHPRVIHGDLQAIAEGLKQAAEFERLAATPMTSDGSLQQAMLMEAKLKGQESIRAGLKADNDEVKRTTDLAIALEKEDKNVRHQVAMKNRENMHQVDLTKLQAETTKIRSDYESTKNFVDEVKRYYITEHAKKLKIDDTIYARALQLDIYKNPLNYMPGWNTYHDDIWKRGIAGKQLTTEEQTVFALLKQLFTNAYYSNLYYNTTPIDTSVKDITGTASDWAIVRSLAGQKAVKEEKKGGKLNKDDAKIVLEFLKESNKNYNKAVDRSARGMYNHIKLLRKK